MKEEEDDDDILFKIKEGVNTTIDVNKNGVDSKKEEEPLLSKDDIHLK